jgi:hypothetical protein
VGRFRRKIRNRLEGTGYVANAGGVPPSMQGAATVKVNADPNRPPLAGMTLPVVVDPRDPQHLDVDVKSIPSTTELLDAEQQRALDAIRAMRDDDTTGR